MKKQITVIVDVNNNQTAVGSNFDAWTNMALLLEGIGVTLQKCVDEGIPKEKVIKEVYDYFEKVARDYKIVFSNRGIQKISEN